MDIQDGQDGGKINHPLRWRHGGAEKKDRKRSGQIRFDRTVCLMEGDEKEF